ncbi:lipoprotein [Thermodesulfomicrobium sp. WS]|nr:lipoprotein [Thermodesulfomicrobium sp. WS]
MIMYRTQMALVFLLLAASVVGCGKKEWPKPQAQEEQVFVDTIEARRDGPCLWIAVKVGGNLANVEFFRLEVETDGCPTCPFAPTMVRQISPYDSGVRRQENSYVLRVCGLNLPETFRLRVGVDNTFATLPPALSPVITIEP